MENEVLKRTRGVDVLDGAPNNVFAELLQFVIRATLAADLKVRKEFLLDLLREKPIYCIACMLLYSTTIHRTTSRV
jgi:hypothetical protein